MTIERPKVTSSGANAPRASAGVSWSPVVPRMSYWRKIVTGTSTGPPLSCPAGKEEAKGAALLVVNEPIHVLPGSQNSVRYNAAFPRWAYDAYRQAWGGYVQDRGLRFLDLWDFLADSGFFVNSSLHRSAAGEQMLADRLVPEILQSACP